MIRSYSHLIPLSVNILNGINQQLAATLFFKAKPRQVKIPHFALALFAMFSIGQQNLSIRYQHILALPKIISLLTSVHPVSIFKGLDYSHFM